MSASPQSGVLWITGFSASGKTTVARKVVARLRRDGRPTVFLDGDDLRSIFSQKFGYGRDERVELAKIYFRLCSHLAAQGLSVVISAVAMYDEVREWLRANVSSSVEVFLDVPREIRLERDGRTKGVYRQDLGPNDDLYDVPKAADLVIENYGSVDPDVAADRIAEHFLARSAAIGGDHRRREHWNSYYQTSGAPSAASSFALEVAGRLPANVRLLEVGCGNGRDSAYFASCGHSVVAVDMSEAAIAKCRDDHKRSGVRFLAGTLDAVAPELQGEFDAVYSRFCLHAMTRTEEAAFLSTARQLLRPQGQLFIECRSINDPLARKGEVISPTERIFGHYRRFIVGDELRASLEALQFRVDFELEAAGLAVHGDDDPVVIRLVATRGGS